MKKIVKLTESDLTNIIKKVIKENDSKDSLIDMIKEEGWVYTTELVGGDENLAKLAFNNDPMNFLHIYDDMDVVKSEIGQNGNKNWMLYRYKPKQNIIAYDTKRYNVYFHYQIWWALTHGFGIDDYNEIKSIVEGWLSEVYGLKLFNSFNMGDTHSTRKMI
jgi:hypothetical protein